MFPTAPDEGEIPRSPCNAHNFPIQRRERKEWKKKESVWETFHWKLQCIFFLYLRLKQQQSVNSEKQVESPTNQQRPAKSSCLQSLREKQSESRRKSFCQEVLISEFVVWKTANQVKRERGIPTPVCKLLLNEECSTSVAQRGRFDYACNFWFASRWRHRAQLTAARSVCKSFQVIQTCFISQNFSSCAFDALLSDHNTRTSFLTWQCHEVHLGLKKILIMSFTVTITRSSRRSETTFLTTVLEVWWIANQVLSTFWLNLGVPCNWHHRAKTAKI